MIVRLVVAARNLATRTGGVYAAATDPGALTPIFEIMAEIATRGQVIVIFKLAGDVPPSGTLVEGYIVVSSGGGTETVAFAFTAP